MQVTDIVSAKTRNIKDVNEVDVAMAIEEATQFIFNYCNIDTIPTELNFVLANMSVDLLKFQYESTKDISNTDIMDTIDPAAVASIKEGDTTISFGVPSGASQVNSRAKALKSHAPNLDSLLMNYKLQLENYRKLI